MKFNKKTIIIGIIAIILIAILLFFLSFRNKVTDTKRVEGLVISNIKITEENSISFLSANVKNSTKKNKEDIKLKITFYDKKRKEITSVTGYLGDVDAGKTQELNAAISMELKNLRDIKYEIIN